MTAPSETPRADAIVDAYLEKCDRVNPDGSTSEDIERDLREPIRQLERELGALRLLEGMDALEASALGTYLKGGDIPNTIDAARGALVARTLNAERALADAKNTLSASDPVEIMISFLHCKGYHNAAEDVTHAYAIYVAELRSSSTGGHKP